MTAAESRVAMPEAWSAYDDASELAFLLADGEQKVTFQRGGGILVTYDRDRAVGLLDLLRKLLRGRIERGEGLP